MSKKVRNVAEGWFFGTNGAIEEVRSHLKVGIDPHRREATAKRSSKMVTKWKATSAAMERMHLLTAVLKNTESVFDGNNEKVTHGKTLGQKLLHQQHGWWQNEKARPTFSKWRNRKCVASSEVTRN